MKLHDPATTPATGHRSAIPFDHSDPMSTARESEGEKGTCRTETDDADVHKI
ncbi:hypothetical protein [Paractinoplanes brasiliensis]|uniref:hypothetical protein n=1 Tax=Paractinoplanes brasiliensis TaxID=52695 RepID=UPI00141504BC|nr:hypothetical protein [Actinoplanes brasiliensis]